MIEQREQGTIEAETLQIITKGAEWNTSVIQKWQVQESNHGCRKRSVTNANPLPVKGNEYDGQQFHHYREPKRDGSSRPPSTAQRSCGQYEQ